MTLNEPAERAEQAGGRGVVRAAIETLRRRPDAAKPCVLANSGKPVEPAEVWIGHLNTWLRLDGSWISGWYYRHHFGFRPSWLQRWQIRRAARHWDRARASQSEAS